MGWTNAAAGARVVGLLAVLGAVPALAQPRTTGAVVGEVVVLKEDGAPKADRSGVVVSLEGVPGPAPAPVVGKKISQHNLAFEPLLTVVTQGSTIEFPNRDKVFHNVFSLSSVTRFDLGLYKSGTSRTVTFTQPGVVEVFCNIHPEMIAKIKVMNTGFYAVTGPDGRFRIDNVPPGRYPLIAWQAFGEPFRGEVTVGQGVARVPSVTLTEGPIHLRHVRKDGTPYGRYK